VAAVLRTTYGKQLNAKHKLYARPYYIYMQARRCRGHCAGLDQTAPTEGTFALYNRLPGQKEIRVYPKFGHERINQFENEQINYLCEVISGLCHN